MILFRGERNSSAARIGRGAGTAFVGGARATVLWLFVVGCLGAVFPAGAQVVINEIMYHPVEEPAFNADGSPALDLYEDVHEFVELHNAGAQDVSLAGWEISGGIQYSFPAVATLGAGQYLVVAKDPARLAAVGAYGLRSQDVLGPWQGRLSNHRDTLRLRDARQQTVDAVSYAAEFPWPIGADALGADEEWTGLRPLDYQYRGRSLERVSARAPANDPANWLASPIPGNPSPGRPNAVTLPTPRPVVTSFSAVRASDESPVILKDQPVMIRCGFSATNGLSGVSVEWFLDQIDATNESPAIVPMIADAIAEDGRYHVNLPGQAERRIVRYRFRADRGTGDEVVSPRPDDPYPWHAYFVSPVRSSPRPIYDLFVSASSLKTLANNISQSPRRVTSPDPPGKPRAAWNASEPATVVYDNVVYDARAHYHGSRYNRNTGANSWQWRFPRYRPFNGATALLVTDKGQDTIWARNLFLALGMPVSLVRWVDLYVNNGSALQRLEQGEFDGDMLDAYHLRQQALDPGSPLEPTGDIHKDTGTIEMNGEGPYGRGDERKLSKPSYWTDLQMYDWTYPLQNHAWRGPYDFKKMLDAFWTARGDTPNRPAPNIPAMREFFNQYYDIEEMLNYIALENWCCPWDDTTQNHFLWQRRNGRWGLLPWDMDAWFGNGDNTPASSSIYIGEVGDPNNNYRGPNFIKDGFIKAFRQELKERYFLLNHTLLHPDNLRAMGYSGIVSFAQARFQAVNQQCGLGVFQRPNQPVALAPRNSGTALPPAVLETTPYTHSASPAPAHATTRWEIRAADGSYDAPVWRLVSATNLTSAPIPFAQLNFGQSYFWRCTYFDAQGHPSLISDESNFRFGPAPADRTLVAIDASTRWKYDQSGADLSAAGWADPAFNDSAWPSGPGILAKEEATLPEPIRTPLTLGKLTYYFRTHFDFPGDPRGAKLRLRLVIDDGCVVYLNGKEVYRLRLPEGPVTYSTLASANVSDAVAEGPFEIAAANLNRGDNVLAVEVHQSNAASSDLVFGLALEASIPAVSGEVVINEIAARNSGSVMRDGRTPDWIELFNSGSQTVDLGGASLTDDVLRPYRFVFPTNTLIPAQGYLTVWCDDATNSPGWHTGFALRDQGQTVALFAPDADGMAVKDYVTFGLQVDDLTIGRVPDGKGAWALTQPTPGARNQPQALVDATWLRINEWMAAPAAGDDWFELYNAAELPVALAGLYFTDDLSNPANTRLPELSFIGAQDYVQLIADQKTGKGADHVDFKLSANGEVIGLFATNGLTRLDAVSYGVQTVGVSQGRLPDGGSNLVFFPATASPGARNHLPLKWVVFNEVLAHSEPPFEDSIELLNGGNAPVDLGGWWLSDNARQPRRFQIPANTVVRPGGYVVFYEGQFNADTNSPASFALSGAHGDELLLSATDAAGALTGYRAELKFAATASGISLGRFPTSQGFDFVPLDRPTFGMDNPATTDEFRQGRGLTNSPARVGPVVVSEIMYRPPPLGTNENHRDEFLELHNVSAAPVPLYDPQAPTNTWRLRRAVEFEFPQGVVVPAGGCLVLVSFDPAADTATRTKFEAVYGLQTRLFGPFRGKLDNLGEPVELWRPDAPLPPPSLEAGFVPYLLVERIFYGGAAPWPGGANGTGASLQRIAPGAYGNEPSNWKVAPPNPGQAHGASGPVFRLEAIPDLARGILRIRVTGVAAATLTLQGSADLMTWSNLETSSVIEEPLVFERSLWVAPRQQYYRVRLAY